MVRLIDLCKNHFPVGLFYLVPELWTEKGVRQASETGADFFVSVRSEEPLLSLCEEHNMGLISSSNLEPTWWGGDGTNAGGYEQQFPLDALNKVVKDYPNSPYVWGDYQVDEPNVMDYKHINKIAEMYAQLLPDKLFFLNLYPSYGSLPKNSCDEIVKQLGCANYTEYIDQYVREVDLPYICFDYYPYTGENVFATYLENLDIVAKACVMSKKEMWVVIQTGAWRPEEILKECQLEWQVYLSLAYGAKAIMHACYSHCWWDPTTSCVDAAGNKNPTYDYVKRINSVLHSELGLVILKYEYIGTTAFGEINASNVQVKAQLEKQYKNAQIDGIPDFEIHSDSAVIVGFFRNNNDIAVMVVNSHNPFDPTANADIHLGIKKYKTMEVFSDTKSNVSGSDIATNSDTLTRIKLSSGQGALVVFKRL